MQRNLDTTTQRSRSTSEGVVKVSCDVLEKVFSNMKTIDVLDKFGSLLHAVHPCVALNVLCLQQVHRLADEGNFSYFMSTPQLIQVTANFLCEENSDTSALAAKILRKLTSLSGNGWLFCEDFLKLFKHLLATKNAVVKFRIYDVFVDYITKYPEYIEECKRCGIFDDLVRTILHSNDILSQLNALELLSQIAVSSPAGLDFIQEAGVMSWLSNTYSGGDGDDDVDPLTSFLLPGCVKFIGVLCATNPMEIIPHYKHMVRKIFQDVNNEDITLSCLCVETISFICTKDQGLKVLYETEPDALKHVVMVMTSTISNPGEDDYVRERTLQSLTSMFHHDDVNDVQLTNICEKLYRYLNDDNPMTYLFKLVRIPFAEVRHGAFKLLAHLSKYSWVEQDMVLCAGFIEYLLDRNTETEKEGHELKFVIVQHLARSSTALDNFGVGYFDKLDKYCEQGAFYSESHVSVTYEGDQ